MKDQKQIHWRIPDDAIPRQFVSMVAQKYGATYTYLGIELCAALQLWIEKNNHLTETPAKNNTHTHQNKETQERIQKIREYLGKIYAYPDIKERVLDDFIRKTGVTDSRTLDSYKSSLLAQCCIERIENTKRYKNLLYTPKEGGQRP